MSAHARRPDGGRRRETGTSLIEVMLATALVGILANIAAPIGLYLVRRAEAQSIINDFLVVQQAAVQYRSDRGVYPPERAVGVEPRELRQYIKGNVNWNNTRLRVRYDWENWLRPNGNLRYPAFRIVAGFTIETSDTTLQALIRNQYPGPYVSTFRNTRLTIPIELR